jgi:anti-sigma factor RsiW
VDRTCHAHIQKAPGRPERPSGLHTHSAAVPCSFRHAMTPPLSAPPPLCTLRRCALRRVPLCPSVDWLVALPAILAGPTPRWRTGGGANRVELWISTRSHESRGSLDRAGSHVVRSAEKIRLDQQGSMYNVDFPGGARRPAAEGASSGASLPAGATYIQPSTYLVPRLKPYRRPSWQCSGSTTP